MRAGRIRAGELEGGRWAREEKVERSGAERSLNSSRRARERARGRQEVGEVVGRSWRRSGEERQGETRDEQGEVDRAREARSEGGGRWEMGDTP